MANNLKLSNRRVEKLTNGAISYSTFYGWRVKRKRKQLRGSPLAGNQTWKFSEQEDAVVQLLIEAVLRNDRMADCIEIQQHVNETLKVTFEFQLVFDSSIAHTSLLLSLSS